VLQNALYGVWGELTEALKTGEPQSEVKLQAFFEEIYSDSAKLEQFMQAMWGLSRALRYLAERFDFGRFDTVCDVGGATGQLCATPAGPLPPYCRCTTYDQPVVAPIAERSIVGRRANATGSASPRATSSPRRCGGRRDTMCHILHDWNLDKKKQLISAAYDALSDGGAFIVVEHLIADARPRQRVRADDVAKCCSPS